MKLQKPVANVKHYTNTFSVECIDINIYLNSYLSNVCKYLYRWDLKGTPVEDLEKAFDYLFLNYTRGNSLPDIILNKHQLNDRSNKLKKIKEDGDLNLDFYRSHSINGLFLIQDIERTDIFNVLENFSNIDLIDPNAIKKDIEHYRLLLMTRLDIICMDTYNNIILYIMMCLNDVKDNTTTRFTKMDFEDNYYNHDNRNKEWGDNINKEKINNLLDKLESFRSRVIEVMHIYQDRLAEYKQRK